MGKQRKKKKISLVTEACELADVTETVFYTARKGLEEGRGLTTKETRVLARYSELIEQHEKDSAKAKSLTQRFQNKS